jgi:hypothetical protein
MLKPPLPKRNWITPPTLSLSPRVSPVHLPQRLSRVVNAFQAASGDDDLIPACAGYLPFELFLLAQVIV